MSEEICVSFNSPITLITPNIRPREKKKHVYFRKKHSSTRDTDGPFFDLIVKYEPPALPETGEA